VEFYSDVRRISQALERHGSAEIPPHVMRCRECGGLEQGQVFTAEDEVEF